MSGQNRIKSLPEAIYALPDHEVVAALLPEAFREHLAVSAAVDRLRANPGLVPVAIDPRGEGCIIWADLGRHPFKEWQFVYTVRYLAENGRIGECFTSEMAVLDQPGLFQDSVVPSAFVFHISRCGSTLVAKALARPEGHMMISQGGPLQYGFWSLITDDWRKSAERDGRVIARLRALVLALCRRRVGNERCAFVKFISWNVLYSDLLCAAFPEARCLFLYRDPVEVVASIKRGTTTALQARGTRRECVLSGLARDVVAKMDDIPYLASCFARYLDSALAMPGDIAYVNYRDLTAENFSRIVSEDGLGLSVSEADQALMRDQFRYHAKDDSADLRFRGDTAEKQAAVPLSERLEIAERCADSVNRLDASSRNIFAREPSPRARHALETAVRSCP